MLIFILPKTNINIYKYIDIETVEKKPEPFISNSLSYYLNDVKTQIHTCGYKWDMYKKYTNEYEFIHTNIPHKKYCVSKYKPISRSYFKMLELIHAFKLNTNIANSINTFHLAEGPGGFIEAVVNIRKKKKYSGLSTQDKYYGMTLLNTDTNASSSSNIPGWKKGEYFLKKNKNVQILKGQDETGDILSLHNFINIYENYGGTMDLITADGGFDFSNDFNSQELNIAKLLYGQIIYAISMQKFGGCFVLKIFDCFLHQTVDMLLLLSSFYEYVFITKPFTSRSANSEKYIVCKGFKHYNSFLFYPYLLDSFTQILKIPNCQYINRILKNFEIPYFFLQKIEKYNGIYGEIQLKNIQTTLDLIDEETKIKIHALNNKINKNIQMNVNKCVKWCILHDMPYNFFHAFF
jgi:23S rRNA U2552 (ribose-2'-O)-methylase RlmE/FtsJ